MKNPLTDNLGCLYPLRAGRGELERARLGALFGDSDTVPPKVPLSLRKRERVRVSTLRSGSGSGTATEDGRVRLDGVDTAKQSRGVLPMEPFQHFARNAA